MTKRVMKVEIGQPTLAQALDNAMKCVSQSATLPVLNNVLLKKAGGALTVATTNLETTMVQRVAIANARSANGAITVPAAELSELVKLLPDAPVHLEVEDKAMHLVCEKVTAQFKGIEADLFPMLPEPPETPGIRVAGPEFAQAIKRVAFMAAKDMSRPTLTGVLLRFTGERLVMAATDGFRLAEVSIQVATEQPVEMVVPATSLKLVAQMAEQVETVTVHPLDEMTHFDMGDVQVRCNLLSSNYPNYEALIPKRHVTRLVVNRAELLGAFRLVNVVAREVSYTAKLTVVASDEGRQLVSHAISPELGSNRQELSDAQIEGEAMTVELNGRYLVELLQAFTTPQVELLLLSPHEVVVARPVGEDNFLYLLMPMHVKTEE